MTIIGAPQCRQMKAGRAGIRPFAPPHLSWRGQFVGSCHGLVVLVVFRSFCSLFLAASSKLMKVKWSCNAGSCPIAGALSALLRSVGFAWHAPDLSQFGDVHCQSSGIWRKHAPRAVFVSKKDKFKRAGRTCCLDTYAPPLFASDEPGARDSSPCICHSTKPFLHHGSQGSFTETHHLPPLAMID